jgi:hypothetical protein
MVDQLESADNRTGWPASCSGRGWNDAVFNALVLAEVFIDSGFSDSA